MLDSGTPLVRSSQLPRAHCNHCNRGLIPPDWSRSPEHNPATHRGLLQSHVLSIGSGPADLLVEHNPAMLDVPGLKAAIEEARRIMPSLDVQKQVGA